MPSHGKSSLCLWQGELKKISFFKMTSNQNDKKITLFKMPSNQNHTKN